MTSGSLARSRRAILFREAGKCATPLAGDPVTMTMRSLLALAGALLALSLAARAVAQEASAPAGDDSEPAVEPPPPGDPAEAEPQAVEPPPPQQDAEAVVVDERQRELERAQRELEAEQQGVSVEDMVHEGVQVDAEPSDSRHHGSQIGVRLAFVYPWLLAIKYKDGPACSDELDEDGEPEEFCIRGTVPTLDFELAFGASERLEIAFAMRFGLDQDEVSDANPLGIGLGIRAYPAPHSVVKAFISARLWIDIQSSDADNWNNVDVGARGAFGIQVDPARFLGIFAQAGMTIFMLRGFWFMPDVGGGVQIRFP